MKHLIQDFDIEVLDLVKQRGFYPYEKFKEKFPNKKTFYSSLGSKEIYSLLLPDVFEKIRNRYLEDYVC